MATTFLEPPKSRYHNPGVLAAAQNRRDARTIAEWREHIRTPEDVRRLKEATAAAGCKTQAEVEAFRTKYFRSLRKSEAVETLIPGPSPREKGVVAASPVEAYPIMLDSRKWLATRDAMEATGKCPECGWPVTEISRTALTCRNYIVYQCTGKECGIEVPA